jgi:hypothetical protein
VPAANPTTYIEIGTVANETSGAIVAPTIAPVAKITAEFAPVNACAAASRTTFALTRASLVISSVAVRSIIGTSALTRDWRILIPDTMDGYPAPINRPERAQAMQATHAKL